MQCFGLTLTAADLAAVALDAQRRYPEEACGLGFGPPGRVERWVAVPNVAPMPRRAFVLAPDALLVALADADAEGLALRVIYHSHPDGPPVLSARDLAEARYAGQALWPHVVQLVVSVRDAGPVAISAHRVGSDTVASVSLDVPAATELAD